MGDNMKIKKYRRNKKKIMLVLLSFLLVMFVGVTLFINLDPTFGGNPTKEQKEYYKHVDNYVNGKFVNEIPTSLKMSLSEQISMIKDSFAGAKGRNPDGVIPASKIDWNKIKSEKDSLTWLGHSYFSMVGFLALKLYFW